MVENIVAGDIILLNRKGESSSFFSSCQRFFTKMPYTHTAIIIGEVEENMSVLSADEMVVVMPLKKYLEEKGTDIEIYHVNGITDEKKKSVIKDLYYDFSGTFYGFLQVLWFIYRWFMESVFQKDVRKFNNPFSKGEICSELVWHYLNNISDFNTELKLKVNEWGENTINAGDIANICKNLPNVFSLVYSNKG